jgi:hypothetical protein
MEDRTKESYEKLVKSIENMACVRPEFVLFEKSVTDSQNKVHDLMVIDANYGYIVIDYTGATYEFITHLKKSDHAIEFAIDKARELNGME